MNTINITLVSRMRTNLDFKKIINFGLAFCFVFFSLSLRLYAYDLFEENDSFAESRNVFLGTYEALDCEDGDPDFYAFTFGENRNYNISISFDHSLGDLDLFIYDSNQKLVGSSLSMTDNESVTITDVPEGDACWESGCTYYIEVRFFGNGSPNNYAMTLFKTAVWKQSARINQGRSSHTATQLSDGRVLIAGGKGDGGLMADCEIFDPSTGTWSVTGALIQNRMGHTATLLKDGRVLVAGGYVPNGAVNTYLSSCELFDPATGTWSNTGDLIEGRSNHTATLFSDGRVIVTGGIVYNWGPGDLQILITGNLEIYDPSSGTWANLFHDNGAPYRIGFVGNHTVTLLSNDRLLLAGGESSSGQKTACDRYDPAKLPPTPNDLNQKRSRHTATTLPDGRILVTGGLSDDERLTSCELYNPISGEWSIAASLNKGRYGHTANLLSNGRVLVTGGDGDDVSTCELYDPENNIWMVTTSLHEYRHSFTSTRLADGRILVVGGQALNGTSSNTSELYNVVTGEVPIGYDMNRGRSQHTSTQLGDGRVLIVGGQGVTNSHTRMTHEIYNPENKTWALNEYSLNSIRISHTATQLPNGQVLVVGSPDSDHENSSELFDPENNVWTLTGLLSHGRTNHTATLLTDGRVLVTGGYNLETYDQLTSCEIYDPTTGSWRTTGALSIKREKHTATLLSDGTVLVAGGYPGEASTSCERYNPATGSWTITGTLKYPASDHSAILLQDGRVLKIGGGSAVCELYDPMSGNWSETRSLDKNRLGISATLLLDGRVLVTGGKYSQDSMSIYLFSCIIYDPLSGSWSSDGYLSQLHSGHRSNLLLDGSILLTGGRSYDTGEFWSYISELYELDHESSWRPVIDTLSTPLVLGNSLSINGNGFLGISEASGGNGTRNSTTNHPVVQLRHMESNITRWLSHDITSPATDTHITTSPVAAGFPDGHAMVTVYTNGVPSESRVIQVVGLPSVVSIMRDEASPTSVVGINFTITFSENVTGVDAADFTVTETGTISGGAVTAVTQIYPSVYRVTVSGYSGDVGTVGLDVVDDDSIVDVRGFSLGGSGTGNGDYQTGEDYDVDLYAPFLAFAAVSANGLDVDVTFSEAMDDGVLVPGNYTISGDGINPTGHGNLAANPDSVTLVNGNTYRLSWNPGPEYARNEMRNGYDVTITAEGLQDLVGNMIGALNHATHLSGGVGAAPVTYSSPAGDTYDSVQSVTFSCDDGINGSGCAGIYFTTDGSLPTQTSSIYSGSIDITQDTLLRFISVDNAGNASAVQNEAFTIDIPSAITCEISADNIILGENINVSGTITPSPGGSAPGLGVILTPPSGDPVVFHIDSHSGGNFSSMVPCHIINTAGSWSIQAVWDGDTSHSGAASGIKMLGVSTADTGLSLDIISGERVKIDDEPPIGGKLTPSPSCIDTDLTGILIKVEITGPNNETDILTTTTNDRWGHFSLLNYNSLTALGTWTVQAVFEGNEAYESCLSEPVTINVVETAGYAVIVQGKLMNDEGLESHNKTTNLIYNTLISRGLLDEDIYYFNYGASQIGVDIEPSKTEIQTAITTWARNKINANPANLFIAMIDHGFDEEFHIDTDTEPVVISSSELASWIDELQVGLLPGDAANQEIISILGFCRSGSFIDELSGPNRIIITSANEGESSYKGPMDQLDGIREGEYFVSELFKSASYGKSIRQCFQEALVLTEAFTSSDKILSANSPFKDNSRQHPLLDDNADGVGSNYLDNSGDGEFSDTLFFGITPVTGNDPGDVNVVSVTPTLFLDDLEESAMLWARVDDNTRMSSLWAEIKVPGHDPIDTTTGQATMDLIVVPLTQYDSLYNYYEPLVTPDVFTQPGIYHIFYFATDTVTGRVSSLKQSIVYKNQPGNTAPNNFHLLYPNTIDDPVFRTSGFILGWQTTTDPDEDSLTYTVDIVNDPSDPRWGAQVFSFTIEHLTHAMVFIGPEASFIQNRRYIWQVKAIDQYGATTASLETDWTFEINNDNAINGWISGGVFDMNDTAILDADVAVQGFYVEMLTDNNGGPTGYYMGTGHPGDYQLTATASGYETNNRQVTLLNGGFSNGDITLSALTQQQVSDPLVTPVSGIYTPALEINISCDTPDADIYYTKDGSDPDEGSILYQGAFDLIGNGDFTLKAKAYVGSWSPSNIVSVDFTLIPDPGDFNGNGQIGIDDVQVLSDGFGEAGSPNNADADNDGDVDGLDMIELIDAMNAL